MSAPTITHYVIGCPEYCENGNVVWHYLKSLGAAHNGKIMVRRTVTDILNAHIYTTLPAAITTTENIWGIGWVIFAEPIHEAIDKKLYAQIQQEARDASAEDDAAGAAL